MGNEALSCGSDCPDSITVNGFQTSSGRLHYEFLACSGTFHTSKSLAFYTVAYLVTKLVLLGFRGTSCH